MHVTFDVDGVLADFSAGFCGVLKDRHALVVDPRACKSWHWFEWVDGFTKKMEGDCWDAIFNDPAYSDFWRTLSPLCTPEDVRRINDLSRRNIVSFVTNRSAKGQQAEVALVTRLWLDRQGIVAAVNTYLAQSGQKGVIGRRLGTHIAIEDNGPNVLDYLDHGIAVALLRRAYNEAYVELVRARGGYVVDTLSEFLDLCMKFDAAQQGEGGEMVRSAQPLWNRPLEQDVEPATA